MSATSLQHIEKPFHQFLCLRRLEGAAIGLASVMTFAHLENSWWMFAALFLAPDLSMLGYVFDARIGARLYNLGHTYLTPVLVGVLALTLGSEMTLAVATIWVAHIGFDRMLGYGLKYPTGFKDTHLSTMFQRGMNEIPTKPDPKLPRRKCEAPRSTSAGSGAPRE